MCWLLFVSHALVVVAQVVSCLQLKGSKDGRVHVCYWHAAVCVELLFAVAPNLCDVTLTIWLLKLLARTLVMLPLVTVPCPGQRHARLKAQTSTPPAQLQPAVSPPVIRHDSGRMPICHPGHDRC